ncbi:TonB-dependent receptor [Gaoshiqia sediminis]|uniref:TonB-dependent receptor n=1 Tax=Gaoshiqia sediminis TaxID=2986998 RepID=A0AA41Y449_9BACT|nr:TonB-dependent receptor [Gaoshiqia sediminis]MCW0483111.1 TonB-dependent receptor [Gaoshiqia sediminis]
MKLTLLLIMLTVFSSLAADLYSQNTKLSLEYQNEKIVTVLREIEDKSEFRFFFNEEIDVNSKVSIDVSNAPIQTVMDEIFRDKNVNYEIIGRQVILRAGVKMNQSQQPANVSGKVTDSSGQPLPGVTVVVKGTTAGTITDVDGNYNLSNVPSDAVLQISFVGMKAQEIPVGGKREISVTLTEETIGLEEVVAVGYGTQKKVNLTGAIASVSGEDIVKRPVTNAASMIQGLMPGVQITQNSGEPGNEGISIRIRGTGTFSSAGSDPLVLIDGIQGDLSDLNPNNIESVSVLKDAASASIYGSRAANGVILVTTKTGEEGKINMEYSGNYGIHKPTKMYNLVTNSAEYMELYNEARLNSGLNSSLYSQEMIDAYRNATDRNLYPNTDWLDLIFSPAPTQTHNLAFSGGSKSTKFNISLGYVNQEGVMKGFDYEKFNTRFNISSMVNEKIKFGGSMSVKKGERSGPRSGSQDSFVAAMAQPPTYGPYLPDGSGRYTFKAYDFEYNNKNPIAIIDEKVFQNTTDYAITLQGWLDVELTKNLKWYTKAATNLDFSKFDDFRPQVPLYNFHTGDYMTLLDVGGAGLVVQDDQNVYQNLYTYLSLEKKLGDHNFFIQGGYSIEDNIYQYLRGYRKEYPSDILRQLNAGSPSVQQANGTKNEWALMSFFGRLNYNYKDRYLFEANIRRDGSSRFASDSRWGTFPSFSAGWRINEENFMKSLNASWLNNLKLRGSYGELGNQNIGLYPYQSMLALSSNYSFDDASLGSGVAQQSLSNEKIRWESTSVLDFGLDVTAFNGLSLTLDWYKKRTTDILRGSQVTGVVGLNPPTINNGTMENTGIEATLQYQNHLKGGYFAGLNYRIGLNADHYKNKLVDFGAREISGYYLREESYEWDTFYMLEQIGIFQSTTEIANSPKQFNDATVPGDLKFKDANKDGKIDNDDRVPIKGRYPALNYSMNFSATWKGFDLSAQLQGVHNVKYYVDGWGTIPFVQGAPPTTDWRNRWTEENPSTTMPRIYWGWGAPERISRRSTWYLQDGSYLRLKNLTVGYTLPNQLTQQIGLKQLRIYFSGDNLFTITDYPGLDPERGGSGSFVNYPQNKIYSFGLNVKF